MRDALAARDVDVDQMIAAGLLVHGEGIAVPYRPLPEPGDVSRSTTAPAGSSAFGGRAMETGAKAKYLNSPETETLPQGFAMLYNHHRARKAGAREGTRSIAVEGYVDVIAMTAGGLPARRSRRWAPR